jgi:hypothetical protein
MTPKRKVGRPRKSKKVVTKSKKVVTKSRKSPKRVVTKSRKSPKRVVTKSRKSLRRKTTKRGDWQDRKIWGTEITAIYDKWEKQNPGKDFEASTISNRVHDKPFISRLYDFYIKRGHNFKNSLEKAQWPEQHSSGASVGFGY